MKTLVHIKTAVIIVNPGRGVQATNGIRDSKINALPRVRIRGVRSIKGLGGTCLQGHFWIRKGDLKIKGPNLLINVIIHGAQ